MPVDHQSAAHLSYEDIEGRLTSDVNLKGVVAGHGLNIQPHRLALEDRSDEAATRSDALGYVLALGDGLERELAEALRGATSQTSPRTG